MLKKIVKWFNDGNKKSMERIQKTFEENNNKVNRYLQELMNTEGLSRSIVKGKLFGTNRISKTFAQVKVDYVGGYYEAPEGKEDVEIMVTPEGLLFEHLPKNDLIPLKDIIKVEFKSETEIQKDVTLTRMVAFGVYALAMKKKKKVVHNYVVVKCQRNEMPFDVLFAGEDASVLYTNIFKLISEK